MKNTITSKENKVRLTLKKKTDTLQEKQPCSFPYSMLLNLHLRPRRCSLPGGFLPVGGREKKGADRLFVPASESFLFSKNTASDRINHVSESEAEVP